jgi:hypothetical protein
MYPTPVLPSAPELGVQEFRMTEVNRKRHFMEDEVVHYLQRYRRYRRVATAFSIVNHATNSIGIALGIGGLGTLASGIGVPVAIGLEIGALGVSGIGGAFAFLSDKMNEKAEKNQKILTIAATKMNSLSECISTAIEDREVSNDEFSLINREVEKYLDLKRQVKSPTVK